MPGTYPNYTFDPKSLQYDIPGRNDIWNGQDGNDINTQIIVHQGILYALSAVAVTRTLQEFIGSNQSSYTINTSQYNVINITGQTVFCTFATTGTNQDGATLRISITGTQSLTFTLLPQCFESSSILLPSTTSGTSRLDMGFLWNTATNLWRVVAVS